ncbi:MAG: DUF3006 domain-containing protein [Clostridia bacterium]|nr:DUF3006 domain-containing protein [Clostridia bacterium]
MKIIVDRFEGNIAVVELEDGSIIDCPKALLPANAKEGSIINITVDEKATEEKLQKLTNRMNRLFKD